MWIVFAALVLSGAAFQPFVPFEELSRDPSAVSWERDGAIHLYTGALSTLGLMGWAAAAAIAGFRAAQFPKTDTSSLRRFFLTSAAISAFLLLDDAYSLHEAVAPHLGIPEMGVFAALGLAVTLHAVFHRRHFLSGSKLLLGFAVILLPLAAGFDFLFPGVVENRYLFEDGSKFIGIWAWAGFHCDLALKTSSEFSKHQSF